MSIDDLRRQPIQDDFTATAAVYEMIEVLALCAGVGTAALRHVFYPVLDEEGEFTDECCYSLDGQDTATLLAVHDWLLTLPSAVNARETKRQRLLAEMERIQAEINKLEG
jgi:hypothetical protein